MIPVCKAFRGCA